MRFPSGRRSSGCTEYFTNHVAQIYRHPFTQATRCYIHRDLSTTDIMDFINDGRVRSILVHGLLPK